jgi:hypothetical protein
VHFTRDGYTQLASRVAQAFTRRSSAGLWVGLGLAGVTLAGIAWWWGR